MDHFIIGLLLQTDKNHVTLDADILYFALVKNTIKTVKKVRYKFPNIFQIPNLAEIDAHRLLETSLT